MDPDISYDPSVLLRLARASIVADLGGPAADRPLGAAYVRLGATFVTLRWPDGDLQGCIGSLEPRRPLWEDVSHNAVAAARHDPRARPLVVAEVELLQVEVSVLSPLEPVAFPREGGDRGEAAARAALRPGLDGVVLKWRGRRATFLPQMWGPMPGPAEFLRELKRKAGLPRDFWDEEVELLRYTVDKHVDGEGKTDP